MIMSLVGMKLYQEQQYINYMKLYATTTSERASKGQGGKYLLIDIYDEKKEHLYDGFWNSCG